MTFAERNPSADFIRKTGASEAQSFQKIIDTFLTWRDDIDDSDPERAVRFGVLVVACVLRDLVLFDRMQLMTPVIPIDDEVLARELPRVFLRCLGVTPPPRVE